MPLFFHVDLDAFFASVEQRDDPSLKGKPVIVGAAPGKRGVVSTCSYEARKFGVHSAMPVSEAVRRCPVGVFLPVRMKRYAEVSRDIMNALSNFTPDFRQLSIDEAMLDMTGTERLWGSPREAAAKIKRDIAEKTGLTISIGIGPNRYVAKVASGIGKPDGLTIVAEGGEAEFMRGLPLEKLWGAGEQTRKMLCDAGIRSIAELQEIPLSILRLKFGKACGEFLHDAAMGLGAGFFSGEPKSRSLSAERTFGSDTKNREEIEEMMRRISDEVSARMWAEKAFSSTIELKLRFGDFTTISRSRSRECDYRGSSDILADAMDLLRKNWDRMKPVRLIGIAMQNVRSEAGAQGELFGSGGTKTYEAEKAVLALKKSGKGTMVRARFIKKK